MTPRPVCSHPRMALATTIGCLLSTFAVFPAIGAPAEDPYEPNNTWTTATALASGVQVEAWISPSGDVDWYTFEATRTGSLVVQLESLPADYDLYLARLNPTTQALDGLAYANHGGTTGEYYSGALQATGTYYVRVYAEEGVQQAEDSYLLRATWPEPVPPSENTLVAGAAQGVQGTEASVALLLANDDEVKALQADLRFDPQVVSFRRGQSLGRGSALTFAVALQGADLVRVVLYSDGEDYLAAGEGAVGYLTFALVGAAHSQSALTPVEVLLSDLDGEPLDVTSAAGSFSVISGQQAPQVHVFALKNPARPRRVQVFTAVDQALSGVPDVLAGTQAVAMTSLDPAENLHLGSFPAAEGRDSLTVSASVTNGVASGSAQTVVVFDGGGAER